MNNCQYTIKDGHGKSLQSRSAFPNYTNVAKQMRSIGAVLPLTVWVHNTITGVQSYDAHRTRRLSEGVRMLQALGVQS